MKLATLMATVAAVFVLSQSAQAHEHHFRHAGHNAARRHATVQQFAEAPDWQATGGYSPFADQGGSYQGGSYQSAFYQADTYHGGAGRRPAAWCGWEMRQLVGGDPGPQFNLARNWSHWGHAGPAGVGAVVVWSHHVGKIVGEEGGQWLVESGNDGHAIRTRVRSIAGAIAIRWG